MDTAVLRCSPQKRRKSNSVHLVCVGFGCWSIVEVPQPTAALVTVASLAIAVAHGIAHTSAAHWIAAARTVVSDHGSWSRRSPFGRHNLSAVAAHGITA